MTDVVKFIFKFFGDILNLQLSLTFDLFGFEVSFLSILLGILILIAIIKLLKFGFSEIKKID